VLFTSCKMVYSGTVKEKNIVYEKHISIDQHPNNAELGCIYSLLNSCHRRVNKNAFKVMKLLTSPLN